MSKKTIKEKLEYLQELTVDRMIAKMKDKECKSTDVANSLAMLKNNGIVLEQEENKDEKALLLDNIRRKLSQDIQEAEIIETPKITIKRK